MHKVLWCVCFFGVLFSSALAKEYDFNNLTRKNYYITIVFDCFYSLLYGKIKVDFR